MGALQDIGNLLIQTFFNLYILALLYAKLILFDLDAF